LLEIQLTNVNIAKNHPVQRAFVSVNGHQVARLEFRASDATTTRSIIFPAGIIQYGIMNEVRFDLPDAVAPKNIGINEDGRLLALYLHRFRILAASSENTPVAR
jgi:hypothetical protein